MRMGVVGGEQTVWGSQVLSQKGPGRHCPPLTPKFLGGDDGWDLGTCARCFWKEGAAGVEMSWLLLAPQ